MIDIILATYNGERFLQQQLLSIQQNSEYQELINRIIVVDDGSTDNTQSIVQAAIKSDSKIEWHHNYSGQPGAMANFAFGLSLSDADYVMLCDQDDIWLPKKIVLSFHAAQKAEDQHNKHTPILIFTDKQIVDEKLNVLCESYFTLKKISKQWHHSFESLSQQNVASGCTMLMNRALLNKSLPMPKQAYMHDWWLALVASRCGVIELVDKPLIQYRQHDSNTIGAKQRKPWQLCTQFPLQLSQFKRSFECIRQQAQAFELFEKKNDLMPNGTIAALAAISKMSNVERLTAYRQGLITRSNTTGKIALLITLLTLSRK
ncbi:glycosyltransferase [Vibrio sp. 10N.222.51.C5]|uniref:glycosyltransferase n=1 Tax=Vibrio sp. 10N.222.51.C5 TaxID=3229623 RepID=UPI0035524350